MNWQQAQGNNPMTLGKPSPVSIGLAVIMIGVIGYLAWQATSKTDSQSYTKGATHNESTITIAPVEHNYPLALPRCGRLFSVDPNWLKDKPEGKKK